MRLIDADTLEKFLQEKVNALAKELGWHDHYVTGLDDAITYIEDAHTVDAEPVRHGRWVMVEGFPVCSECGCSPADWEPKPNNPYGLPPYCHACGAKMDTRLESSRGCATCANDGMDMPQCRECIEHLERPWYRPKDGGAE